MNARIISTNVHGYYVMVVNSCIDWHKHILHNYVFIAFLARRDYVPGELMSSPSTWRRRPCRRGRPHYYNVYVFKGVHKFLIV